MCQARIFWFFYMTATAHALIGASLAAKFSNPLLGIPLAILSHFIFDIIPHWDLGTNHRNKSMTRLRIEAVFDVLLGFGLSFLIFSRAVDPIYLFIMIIAAQLPDWLEAPAFMFGINIPPFSWMDWVGHKIQSRMQLPWGLVTQIIAVGIALLISVNFADIKDTLASLLLLAS
ncbi:MAG: hypothetical protein ACD_57C00211G0005 [uncultured bacterium]|nr:MAG: hypothetical protein ACD_57C00211G0005 [uncultured bacterium]KKR56483.1 MAG: hypothetical protein UT95_C0042G0008 [Candidatus Curtissbacteria bacterium GW2011_GWB1_40_28]KKR61073.1 MAG: hypothetical protein UT99_C0002G0002 [Candidatus Curtissbacteria bacterium GW2011_GWA2_40_31]KKR61952.1 MAG: hypothetical protein UU00_C0005G0008 [Microgenomates group bacterium GW2011_GWC1_40_35]KKS02238.1 MAG: hypothetical protein UU53_C0003G0097 [Candidatus Curtissbacteria bacterium GW2011_GWC2_41_21]